MIKKTTIQSIIDLLEMTEDCSLTIDPKSSEGYKQVTGEVDETKELVLTRADLEKLIKISNNIAFSSFHSSGINEAGNHVSG